MIYSDEDIKLCAKMGSVWMDENVPNWASFISIYDLEMSHCNNCIIGQTIGDYDEVIQDLGYSEEWAAEHGFLAPCHMDEHGRYDDKATSDHYVKLEAAWADEVMNRR